MKLVCRLFSNESPRGRDVEQVLALKFDAHQVLPLKLSVVSNLF